MATDIISAILIIAALLFGAVEVWSSTLVLLMVFTLGLYWMLRREYLRYDTGNMVKALIWLGAGFLAYAVIQVIPMPPVLLGLLAPSTKKIYDFYTFEPGRRMYISLHPYKTVNEALKYLAGFVVFLVAAKNFRDTEKLSRVMKTLVIFGFTLGIFGIVQNATSHGTLYWFRELRLGGSPFGPFVNRNHFAGFVGMIIPLGLGLLFTRRRNGEKSFYGFLTVIMAVSLFFSLSRGGIIGFLAGVSLFSILLGKNNLQTRGVWIIGVFLAALLSYLLYLGVDPIVQRFYHSDVTTDDRLVVGAATINAIKDFWLTGSGLGTFVNVFPLYSPSDITEIFDHAHNDYLEFILETGIIGLLMLLAFISLLIYGLSKSGFQGRKGIFRAAVVSSLFTMTVHGMFDFNLHILSNMLLFFTLLGMAASLIEGNEAADCLRPAVNGKSTNQKAITHPSLLLPVIFFLSIVFLPSLSSSAEVPSGTLVRISIVRVPAAGAETSPRGEKAMFGAEVASDRETMLNGLSERESIPDDRAMLFILDRRRENYFWMKGMRFPLDIVIFDKDRRVLDIIHDLQACENCPLIKMPSTAAYALEINAGMAKSHGLQAGDLFEIN